jgi:hypothetical protein
MHQLSPTAFIRSLSPATLRLLLKRAAPINRAAQGEKVTLRAFVLRFSNHCFFSAFLIAARVRAAKASSVASHPFEPKSNASNALKIDSNSSKQSARRSISACFALSASITRRESAIFALILSISAWDFSCFATGSCILQYHVPSRSTFAFFPHLVDLHVRELYMLAQHVGFKLSVIFYLSKNSNYQHQPYANLTKQAFVVNK